MPLPHNTSIHGFLRSKVIFEPFQKICQAITPLPGILSFSNWLDTSIHQYIEWNKLNLLVSNCILKIYSNVRLNIKGSRTGGFKIPPGPFHAVWDVSIRSSCIFYVSKVWCLIPQGINVATINFSVSMETRQATMRCSV